MVKEGLYFFLPFLVIAAVFFYLFNGSLNMTYIYLGIASFFFGCLIMLFFRDPERKIPQGENLIVSPADGKVVNIENKNDMKVISIFLSIFDVHINRIPVSGEINRLKYKKGKFKAAFNRKASDVNERFEIEIKTDKGNVIVHQIAGVLARRVVCRLSEGQAVKTGERFGMIRFGSRVDLFLPSNAELEVAMGQRVKGAKTIIGRLT
jgi:phosphatidylserine decarboxylase